jgi:hypothetical protein
MRQNTSSGKKNKDGLLVADRKKFSLKKKRPRQGGWKKGTTRERSCENP